MATKKQVYINQIKRLQAQNALLAECLSDERALRKKAYDYYQKKLNSLFMRKIGFLFHYYTDKDYRDSCHLWSGRFE